MIKAPRLPTFSRWQKLSFGRESTFRNMQTEILESIILSGRAIDVGGGPTAKYAPQIHCTGTMESINLDPKYNPTFLIDANKPWPIEAELYDSLISISTLEHLHNDELALRECIRILKPGGTFHIIVSFLYRVHGSPFDYHRHTHYAWEVMLEKAGIPAKNQTIEPMMWDSMSTAFSFLELTRLRYFRPLIMIVGLLRCLGLKGKVLPPEKAVVWHEWALGYYISGTKPEA